MIEKIKTIAWFIRKPQYLAQIRQVLKRKKNSSKENSREDALLWCKSNCISQNEALEILTGKENFESLDLIFPKTMTYANQQVQACPVTMGGEGAISFLYHLAKATESKRIIETGVAYGWSSLAILLAVKDIDEAKLISNDMPYIKMNNDDYVGCVIPIELKNKWELQRLPDVVGIPKAIKKYNNKIDLCHYDSDKSYTGRMFAYPLLWNALADTGIFITDDIQDNVGFKDFCSQRNLSPIIVEHLGKYVGLVRKSK